MADREGQIAAVSSQIEQDLRLVGATAVEDKLQVRRGRGARLLAAAARALLPAAATRRMACRTRSMQHPRSPSPPWQAAPHPASARSQAHR